MNGDLSKIPTSNDLREDVDKFVKDMMMGTTKMPMHMDMHYMWMWFHTKVQDTVLFSSWNVTTPGAMVWTCAIVIAMGIFYEFLKYLRWVLQQKYKPLTSRKTNYAQRLFSVENFLQTILFGVQIALGYLLMLIFMTFSVWLGIAVCLGFKMMLMFFHFRVKDYILFEQWAPTTILAYVFSCLGVAAIAFSYEWIKFGRSKLVVSNSRALNKESCCEPHWDSQEIGSYSSSAPNLLPFTSHSITTPKHLISCVIFFVQLFVDYSLMMVSMTYNVPIFLSLVAGHIVAFFFIGPLTTVEQAEAVEGCCN
ncbi:unnamed protein product [Caenorhabditis auriculariae]|uniref:Copper transport protein n=1 Tax=Caenorhabditis auriculariae TaxID=2777116 RepID=A0A8S1H6R0_9PELO|nr:unnamed protein product [Caenorhabditis auriculariae]